MGRLYGADILTKIQTIATSGFESQLATIRSARSDAGVPAVTKFNIGYLERQYPEGLISMEDSSLDVNELSMDINNTSEEFPVELVIVLKDITGKTYLRQEMYIEALQKLFHGYSDADITYIIVKNSIRANMYTEQKETLRIVGVSLIIRIL